jgi:hypothetical protein
MKNKLKLFVICILLTTMAFSCDSKSDNKKAKEMFLKNLTLLKRSVNERNFSLKDTPKAIKEMEELTSIPSKTHGNYFGKLSPTQGDLIVWENWYKKNQDNLYWDEEDHTIKVKLE